jgi:hypothetical protein
MGKHLSSVCALVTILVGIIGCGTTHQFLPANPIPRHEWQLSINWHYDLDKNIKGLIVPEVSCYTGIGKNWNFGWGMEFPFLISHISAAKYWPDSTTSSWMAYATVNQILWSANNNPYLETGVLHVDRAKTYSQQYGLGLAYGDGLDNPLCTFLSKDYDNDTRNLSHYRLMPVLRYQVSGRDLGISYVHYHGKTATEFTELALAVETANDTILVLPAGTVDSLRALPSVTDTGFFQGIWALYLSTGDTIILAGPFYSHWLCGTGMLLDRMYGWFPHGGTVESKGLKREVVDVYQVGKGKKSKISGSSIHVSISELVKQVQRKEEIVLTKYGPVVHRFIAGLKSYKLDHSIGISTFAYPSGPLTP